MATQKALSKDDKTDNDYVGLGKLEVRFVVNEKNQALHYINGIDTLADYCDLIYGTNIGTLVRDNKEPDWDKTAPKFPRLKTKAEGLDLKADEAQLLLEQE